MEPIRTLLKKALRFFCVIMLGLGSTQAAVASTAVEYYHSTFGHYFVTAFPDEIAALDGNAASGWKRTGQSFPVLPLNTVGATNVCRFWSGQTFAPKSSHFYTSFAFECSIVRGNSDWQFEGNAFAVILPDVQGRCASGTTSLYRVYNNGKGGAPNHRFTTSRAVRVDMLAERWVPEGIGEGIMGCVFDSGPLTVVAAGDIAQCGTAPAAQSAAAQTAALVRQSDDLVLVLGDSVYDSGTNAEYAGCYDPTWGAFKAKTRPVLGNHEYYTPNAEGYFNYFGSLAGERDKGYYSFDLNGWHFIALNSEAEVSVGSPQYEWLKNDLQNSRQALCTVAYWHSPTFSSGANHGGDVKTVPLFDLLQTSGVEILLTGHEHLYERFLPQTAFGIVDNARGLQQFTVGTGGGSLYPFGVPHQNSAYRYNASWGILRLRLESSSYSWQFVPTNGGAPLDSGAAACRR